MNVGIVVHSYGEQQPSGLGRAAFEITKAIVEGDTEGTHYEIFIKENDIPDPEFAGAYTVHTIKLGPFWLERALFRRSRDLDAVLFLSPFVPLGVRCKRQVVVVHDLGLFHTANKSSIRTRLVRAMHTYAIRSADTIVTVSHATKADVLHTLGISEDRISVVYNGHTDICARAATPVEGCEPPYLLYAGVVKERKNVVRIVEAFGILKQRADIKHTLVIAGKYGGKYFDAVQDVMRTYGIEKDVRLVDFISDSQLAYLYKNADAFLYPTLFEGFGMSILEAMGCGAPVITSDLPAQKEAAGDAALCVDPYDLEALADAYQKLIGDQVFRAQLIEKGQNQAARFSWRDTGMQYRQLLLYGKAT